MMDGPCRRRIHVCKPKLDARDIARHSRTKMLLIAGPTCVGKTETAIEVALRCGGEIICADAFQVYEGMPILSAKPTRAQLARVPHHLTGFVPLARAFDVAQWLDAARAAAAEIVGRGGLPILCGGTGLYLRAFTRGLSDLPHGDAALRGELESKSLDELCAELARLDPASTVDPKNKRRLIRAIEVCRLTGRPFSSFREQWRATPGSFTGVLLVRERDDLYARIGRRVEKMFADGLLDEVRALGDTGPTASQALGLAEARACLRGEISLDEAIARIQQATRRYAKRQLTWFRSESIFTIVNLSSIPSASAAIESILRIAKEPIRPANV
jgi:tRNA dimethylallyltransferase